MSAYIVAEIEVADSETYARYRAQTPAAIEAHGGRFIVRGGTVEGVEGEPPAGRVVIIEFPDMAAARRFYDSQEYQALLPLRLAAARSRLYFVEGV